MFTTPLLTDSKAFPDETVLQTALGKSYPVYQKLVDAITTSPYDLVSEWRYYKDGKAWLCKVSFKKKTIFWLSVSSEGIRTTFYFSVKSASGIEDLDINPTVKSTFLKNKSIGKLIPLTLIHNTAETIPDLLKIIAYKKSST